MDRRRDLCGMVMCEAGEGIIEYEGADYNIKEKVSVDNLADKSGDGRDKNNGG